MLDAALPADAFQLAFDALPPATSSKNFAADAFQLGFDALPDILPKTNISTKLAAQNLSKPKTSEET